MPRTIADEYEYDDVEETMSREDVRATLAEYHHVTLADFDADFPLAAEYDSDAVLEWLGY